MDSWILLQVRALTLCDLKDLIPEGYYANAGNEIDSGRADYTIGMTLYKGESTSPGLSPRQVSAADVLLNIGLYRFTNAAVADHVRVPIDLRNYYESSLPQLKTNLLGALNAYVMYLTEMEEKPVYAILNAENSQPLPELVRYRSYEQLRNEVNTMFLELAEIIRTSAMQSAFWNKTDFQKTVVNRLPKSEPDAQPTIAGLLQPLCDARNLELHRESTLAGGFLDFCISGFVEGMGICHVPIEVKNAHASALDAGLTHQLPHYMKAKRAEYGLYLVLWYKGNHFSKPKRHVAIAELRFHLARLCCQHGLEGRIEVQVLELSDSAPSPSQLR
ncbi:hypothetical protein [Chitinimonas sp. JJ19]|uniref:hypothetical protein n=1 Tax=Chitinimonas sp. JJ19 TaxID=3109352 RepID=UPI0030034B5E